MILADLHIHSNFSDGKLSIPELVDFYGQRGFGAIAITDHVCEEQTLIGKVGSALGQSVTKAKFLLYREILKSEKQRAWKQYRMVLIPGVELSQNTVSNKRSAHILALGITDWLSADGDVTELISQIRAQGAVSVAAHPVTTRKFEKQTFHLWDRREELREQFDAWEVASGPHIFDEVVRSKLPQLANSDLHKPSQMTSWKTVFECERHQEAILESIKKQKLSFKYYEERCPNDISSSFFNGNFKSRSWLNPLGKLAGV
jgi:hypothetical protein